MKMDETFAHSITPMAVRRPIHTDVTDQAKRKLDQVLAENGMSIKTLLSRLIEWFASLSKTERSLILGLLDEDDAERVADEVIARRRISRTAARAAERAAQEIAESRGQPHRPGDAKSEPASRSPRRRAE